LREKEEEGVTDKYAGRERERERKLIPAGR
jgi:hypothetical protein